MAVFKIFPERDTFIERPHKVSGSFDGISSNAGLDPVVVLSPQSRILVKFPNDEVRDAILGRSGVQFFLRYYFINGYEVPERFSVSVYRVKSSWEAGVGTAGDRPPNRTGASWTHRTAADVWANPGAILQTQIDEGDVIGRQQFTNYSKLDLRLPLDAGEVDGAKFEDGTDNGFAVRFDVELADGELLGPTRLCYYSRDTFTIYRPCLEVAWDDAGEYPTEVRALPEGKSFIARISNLDFQYGLHDVVRLNVHARLKFPDRKYTDLSTYSGGPHKVNYVLPRNSWYTIIDKATGATVVDQHDVYTRLGADVDGSHFTLYCQNLQRERYYCIKIVSEVGGHRRGILSDNFFKIV